MFSPTLRNLLSSPLDTFQIIFLPDVSTLAIRNVHNILNSGFSVTEKLSNEDIKEITETAQLLSIDITEFCYGENLPSLMKSNQDTGNIGVSIVLRMFDDGNDSVTNFNIVENPSIVDTQMKDMVEGVRGTKRRRSDVSIKKGGKYKCQQCDYENSNSGNVRKHMDSKHEGIRYPCDQCDYKATQGRHLKRHKEINHEGVRYP